MRKAQAITELAILGTIILFLLSIILTYGLRHNYQQEVTQHAFRRAMAASVGYAGASPYSLFHDRHVPNPQDAQGVGTVSAVSASYSIARTYRGLQHPSSQAEIPDMIMAFGRGMLPPREVRFPTARFRSFEWEPCNRFAFRHLQTIYGGLNAWTDGQPLNTAMVVDPCDGDIIGYETCRNQCRMFTDFDFCLDRCREQSMTGVGCYSICQSGLEEPEYCGALDSMFSFADADHPKQMGVQADVIQDSFRDDTFVKRESPGGISSTDTYGSRDVITRRIVFRSGLGWADRDEANEAQIGDTIDMGASW